MAETKRNMTAKYLNRAKVAEARVGKLEEEIAALREATSGSVEFGEMPNMPERGDALNAELEAALARVAELESELAVVATTRAAAKGQLADENALLCVQVQNLEAEVRELNAKLVVANAKPASHPVAAHGQPGPAIGRIYDAMIVPAQYKKADGGVDIVRVNEALTMDAELVIPGINRR